MIELTGYIPHHTLPCRFHPVQSIPEVQLNGDIMGLSRVHPARRQSFALPFSKLPPGAIASHSDRLHVGTEESPAS
jgi:hypothetical protein